MANNLNNRCLHALVSCRIALAFCTGQLHRGGVCGIKQISIASILFGDTFCLFAALHSGAESHQKQVEHADVDEVIVVSDFLGKMNHFFNSKVDKSDYR